MPRPLFLYKVKVAEFQVTLVTILMTSYYDFYVLLFVSFGTVNLAEYLLLKSEIFLERRRDFDNTKWCNTR